LNFRHEFFSPQRHRESPVIESSTNRACQKLRVRS
jgi:hypothetical protein